MNTDEAKSEAAHCLRRLSGKKPAYPVCFDMEDADGYKQKRGGLSKEQAVSICETFLDTMEDNGYYVCLYASLSWLNGLLNDSRLDRFDKWVAQWTTVCEYHPEYGMWQYGGSTNYIETPYISGINGAVDKDYAYKDYPAIIKSSELNNWTVKPKGFLDEAGITKARGWAYNGVNDTPVEVHIYAFKSGEPIFLCGITADEYREDLVGTVGNGYHAFNAVYDLGECGVGEYVVKAFAIGKDFQPQLNGEKSVTVSQSDIEPDNPNPPETPENPEPDTDNTGKGILAALKNLLRLILKWIVE